MFWCNIYLLPHKVITPNFVVFGYCILGSFNLLHSFFARIHLFTLPFAEAKTSSPTIICYCISHSYGTLLLLLFAMTTTSVLLHMVCTCDCNVFIYCSLFLFLSFSILVVFHKWYH